jgi:signal transduction histidine kinase
MMYRTFFAGTRTSEQEVTRSYTMSGIALESSILTHANDELVYLDKANFKEIKRVPLRNTGHVRCFAKQSGSAGGGMIYVGSNNGIFIIDSNGKVLEHLTRLNGLPDNCVYAMIFDGEGLLWCSTNKGVFRLNRDNSILLLRKEDGLQDNEFNTNVVARSDDGEIFFGGVNGISSFYPAAIGSFEESIDLLFTSIKANNEDVIQDSAAWNIPEIRLPYTRNALAFDFITKANNNPDQYIYQYKMDGVDKDWIQNHGMQTVRYSLPPGRYTFKIAASRFFDKDAIAMRTVEIVIRPPFWKTWWFLGGIALLIVGIIAYATNQYSRKRYQKKLVELESDFKVRLERERISRDLHDSIGAYANAVLYSTELLEKEEEALPKAELMKDLKYASKDIITSLRETVWALKKDNYTPEECLLRIRNFIQSLSRIYLNIQFKVEGEASSGEKLHYARALNVVRIMQEAVTNAIKHSGTRHISISSSEQDGKWELKITDDGNGFARNELNGNDPGMGLENMKKRANDSGFGFDIQSRPGSGTSVIILV